MSKISKAICEMVTNFIEEDDNLYYGGGESDWGIEEEDIFDDDSISFDSVENVSDEEKEKQIEEDLKTQFYEDLKDLVNQRTNWEYEMSDVSPLVKEVISRHLSGCDSEDIIYKWREIGSMANEVIKKISF